MEPLCQEGESAKRQELQERSWLRSSVHTGSVAGTSPPRTHRAWGPGCHRHVVLSSGATACGYRDSEHTWSTRRERELFPVCPVVKELLPGPLAALQGL